MRRIHTNNFVPKYRNGKWKWSDVKEQAVFEKNPEFAVNLKKEYIETGIYKFKLGVDEVEEAIFRQEYMRPKDDIDGDVILIQDIKNLVLFMAPMQILTRAFVKFMHTKTVDKVLRSLIIYMEDFLKFVEYLMIVRDNVEGDLAQLQSEESNKIKEIFAERISQHRLLLARDYSAVLLGEGEMKPFHHLMPIVNISMSIRDKTFFEAFITVCQQIVWIAMHRRAYDIIDHEIGRLFRTEHFMTPKAEAIEFTLNEKSMLYGKNYKILNYREQTSPLVQEISKVVVKNLPIFWIGERKYRGDDVRVHQLEIEYITPECQLHLVGVTQGILGHPKRLYNTLLTLDGEGLRNAKFSKEYDPYNIFHQPILKIPELDAESIRERAYHENPIYKIVPLFKSLSKKMLLKWINRDGKINYFKTEGAISDVWMRAREEVRYEAVPPNIEAVIKEVKEHQHRKRVN